MKTDNHENDTDDSGGVGNSFSKSVVSTPAFYMGGLGFGIWPRKDHPA